MLQKTRDTLLYTILISFALGVFVRSLTFVATHILLIFIVISIACFVFFLIQRRVRLIIIPIGMIACLLGMVRFGLQEQPIPSVFLEQIGERVTLMGEIVDEPDVRETNQKLTVISSGVKILVSTDRYPEYSHGDEISITGELQEPENFLTDQGKEFDYISYLNKDDIVYTVPFARVTLLSSGHGSWVRSKLFALKGRIVENYRRLLPEPEASLVSGIVLGARRGIPATVRDDFITTSTIHVVALSGFNVSILATVVMKILRVFFSQSTSIFFGGLTIIFFVLMTGAQSTAIRAGIMALVGLLARATGRTYDASRALFLAGFGMIAVSPKLLAFDVSFQLSFLATLGLIYVTPILEGKFRWIRFKLLRETVSTTLGAQIAVLPLILYKMGILSIIGVPINIIIAPLIPLIMFLGLALSVGSLISLTLMLPLALITSVSTSVLLWIVSHAADVPYAAVTISKFPLFVTLTLYVVLGWICYRFYIRSVKTTPTPEARPLG